METRKPRILVVDDDSDAREFIELYLSRDYEVHTAIDGADALRILESASHEGGIHVVLTDYNMPPGKTGIEWVQAYRTSNPNTLTVFCLATADADFDARQTEARAAGFHSIISKPFQNGDLAQLVADAFKKYDSQVTQ